MDSNSPQYRPPAPTLLFVRKEYFWIGLLATVQGGLDVLICAHLFFGMSFSGLLLSVLLMGGLTIVVLGIMLMREKNSPDTLVDLLLGAMGLLVLILLAGYGDFENRIQFAVIFGLNLAGFLVFLFLRRRTKS